MYPQSALAEGLRQEIAQTRALLREMEARRDGILAYVGASRLREDPTLRGQLPGWATESAHRQRLSEIEDLNTEIEHLTRRIAALCDRLPDNPHGTPVFEFADPDEP